MKKKLLIGAVLCALLSVSAFAANLPFADVPEGAWYKESVQYMYDNGLMRGTSDTVFAPDGNVNRAMFVTILHRLAGTPAVSKAVSFADVASGSYYEDAVAWAAEKKIVTGYSDTHFGPNDSITREQIAVMLCRYAAFKGENVSPQKSLAAFADADDVASYALEAMRWANEKGFITGVSATQLKPRDLASRAQVAAIVMRYNGSVQNAPEETPASVYTVTFKDYDGRVLKSESVEHGKNATPPSAPERKGYTFKGWQGSYKNVTADTTVTAQYSPIASAPTTPVAPQPTEPTIAVNNVSAVAGQENVRVDVVIRNNPGVLGITLSVLYDDSVMTLVGAENGVAFDGRLTLTKPGRFAPQCRFLWDGQEILPEDIANGTILTLVFDVLPDAPKGTYPVKAFYNSGDIIDNDLQTVEVELLDGVVRIS